MKRMLALLVCPAWFVVFACAGQDAPQTEAQLDAVLQSDASPAQKDAACASLKMIGTEQSIPALAALLTDPQLSHSARYALEAMSSPQAGQALLEALNKTTGSNQLGIINSLAARRETSAAPQLSALLSSPDESVAVAVAQALGRFANADAADILRKAAPNSTGKTHAAEVDGLLICANHFLQDGDKADAGNIFGELLDREKSESIRLAALRGMIRAAYDPTALVTKEIMGNDAAAQAAALQAAAALPGGADTTKALADLLPQAQVPVRIALLQCLQQRADISAVPAIASCLSDSDPHVRLAAIAALSDLGDGSVAVPLATTASSATGEERTAAREALVNLRQGQVSDAMVAALDSAPQPAQLELIRALGDRGEAGAAPALAKWAQKNDDSIRSAAFQALALTADQSQVPTLVQLVVNAGGDDARAEAAEALTSACQHLEAQHGQCDAQALADAAGSAASPARVALLPVCAQLTEASTRDALRAALKDQDPQIREAAQRALCDTRDGQLLPDLIALVAAPDNKKIQALAIRGGVRLSTQEEGVKLANDAKLAALKQMLDTTLDASEKRVVLSGLGAVPDKQAILLVTPMLDEPDVQNEAAEAIIRIANALPAADKPEADPALQKVLALNLSPAAHQSAEKALQRKQ